MSLKEHDRSIVNPEVRHLRPQRTITELIVDAHDPNQLLYREGYLITVPGSVLPLSVFKESHHPFDRTLGAFHVYATTKQTFLSQTEVDVFRLDVPKEPHPLIGQQIDMVRGNKSLKRDVADTFILDWLMTVNSSLVIGKPFKIAAWMLPVNTEDTPNLRTEDQTGNITSIIVSSAKRSIVPSDTEFPWRLKKLLQLPKTDVAEVHTAYNIPLATRSNYWSRVRLAHEMYQRLKNG